MPTDPQPLQPTAKLHDRDLEHHLAALGLQSVEQYVEWCAQHGFSVRVEKHWHQRCKERYFALQRKFTARSTAHKRESRHPRQTILAIANDQLAESDLTQPYLVSISKAIAPLVGDARDAFLRLLLHVQHCANLFANGPVVRQFGNQPGNTFIDALAALAQHHNSWLRSVEGWTPRTHNASRQVSSLAGHLLTRYPVPVFMNSVWFKGDTPDAEQQQDWYKQLGRGKSPRHLGLPVAFTKSMVRHFLRAPADYTVEAACRWAQVLGLGGDVRLVEAILGSKLATHFDHDEFWTSVIRWLIANPTLHKVQIGPVLDYIYHQKFDESSQPHFSISGWTPASLLKQMHQWHDDLHKRPQQPQISWYESGIAEFDWSEGAAASGDLHRWTIKEILTRNDLSAEGWAMRHCVASYEHCCETGKSAIWSMGIERDNGRRKRVLTVEVAVRRRAICQARGKANRMPTAKEMEILRRWAGQEGLTLDDCVRPR